MPRPRPLRFGTSADPIPSVGDDDPRYSAGDSSILDEEPGRDGNEEGGDPAPFDGER